MPVSTIRKQPKPEIINPQPEAQQKFASHVQSIAFNLTLSRRMIDCLQAVRDYGFPCMVGASLEEDKLDREQRAVTRRIHQGEKRNFFTNNFVGFMRSLDNRGLIIWRTQSRLGRSLKKGEKLIVLSKAGELVCALLVEAGLMEPEKCPPKKKSF